MMGGPAAADAVSRARRLPSLRVGLHLVLVDGVPVLPPERLPDLVDGRGRLRGDLAGLGFDVFVRAGARRQLAMEIEAQFRAFASTGLRLDHVNSHHHYHLHPTVCRQILDIGKRHGMAALRVPHEPRDVLDQLGPPAGRHREWFVAPWLSRLRRAARRHGLTAPDQVFGLRWSGAMTEERIVQLLQNLPVGLTEIYCHPATRDGFAGATRGYRYVDELAALTAQRVKGVLLASGVRSGGFSDFAMT